MVITSSNPDQGGDHFVGERQASGPKGTVLFPLSQFPGGGVIVFAFYPITYVAGESLAVGEEWTSPGATGRTLSTSVTGTGSYAGIPCYTTEMRRPDGELVHESCISPHHGLVAHSAFYNVEQGYRTVWVEFTEYPA